MHNNTKYIKLKRESELRVRINDKFGYIRLSGGMTRTSTNRFYLDFTDYNCPNFLVVIMVFFLHNSTWSPKTNHRISVLDEFSARCI